MLGYRPIVRVKMPADVDATYLPIVQAKASEINERLAAYHCGGRGGKSHAIDFAAAACSNSGYGACIYPSAVRRSR